MLKLSILRHAKSSWDDLSLEDFDRPLAKRGANAAADVGAYLREEGLRPDLVLCSAAVRTRATLAIILPELGPPPPEVRYEDGLYLAMPRGMLALLAGVDRETKHVMLVGHNPGLHALALELSGDGRREEILDLATKFPTCALAVIDVNVEAWSDVKPASGRLERFVIPKRIS